MPLYVLDTDHYTFSQRGHLLVNARLDTLENTDCGITIITIEEQIRGRFAQIRAAKNEAQLIAAYGWLEVAVDNFKEVKVFTYDEYASQIFNSLRLLRLRVGTQDLRIAAITLAVGGILLTRNTRDFAQIPDLTFADWTI